MTRYVALLRGINVGGHRKIKMVELKALFERLGCTDVVTYIQSGNVVFTAQDSSNLAQKISAEIRNDRGWEVPVVVLTAEVLQSIMEHCPFPPEQKKESYFALLHSIPAAELAEQLQHIEIKDELFSYSDHCVYFFCAKGYRNATLNNNWLEKKLRVAATTRNYKTMQKLLDLVTV